MAEAAKMNQMMESYYGMSGPGGGAGGGNDIDSSGFNATEHVKVRDCPVGVAATAAFAAAHP
jgi:hypothetical protein